MADELGDDLAYLAKGYDLNSLTVPRLRSILVSHDVPYPASAKKATLIAILQDEIVPQAQKLLRERERVRRTSMGITNANANNTVNDDDDGDGLDQHDRVRDRLSAIPTTPSSTTRGTRARSARSTRGSTVTSMSELDDVAPPPPPSTGRSRRSVARTPTVKHPRTSDDEPTPTIERYPGASATPARKARKSEMNHTPRVAVAAVRRGETPVSTTEVTPKRESRASSIFTDDNPFQSGSPPGAADVTPRASTRKSSRYSTGMTAEKERRRRMMSSEPVHVKQEDGFEVPTRSTFELPSLGEMDETPEYLEESEEESSEPGEEFTPEEQLSLDSEVMTSKHRRAIIRRDGSTQSGYGPWIVILTLLGAFAAWWRQEKIEVGYCGVGKARWSLESTNVPEWANAIEPQCEPCPQHAFCYPNFEARCEPDYILKAHPLYLGGLVPVPPTCEPDGEKARRVKVVADKAIEELRERRAKYECGEPESNEDQEVASPEMNIEELKEQVSRLRRKGMSDEEFEDLWRGALGEISGREEVVTTSKGHASAPVLFLSSTSVANLSFGCAIRRHLRLSLLAYRLPILVLVLLAGAAGYGRSRVVARRADMARVPSLVGMTLDRLATQAALHVRGEAREPWISVGQLRDDVLRDELRGARREMLWKRVRAIVEGNANVRASVREGRGGDVSRVWEWIGGIGGIASPEAPKVRFLPDATDPKGVSDAGIAPKKELKKWDEGRPIY